MLPYRNPKCFRNARSGSFSYLLAITYFFSDWVVPETRKRMPLQRCRHGPRCLLPEGGEPPGASCSALANQAAARTRPHWPPPPAPAPKITSRGFFLSPNPASTRGENCEAEPTERKIYRERERERREGREKAREDALRRRRACGRPHRCRRRRSRRGVAGRGHVRAEGRAAVPRRRRIPLPLRPDRAVPASRGRSTAQSSSQTSPRLNRGVSRRSRPLPVKISTFQRGK
jgi:hypothetical protein